MNEVRLEGGVSARFGFLPRGSQQLVVLFGLIALIGAVVTMGFAYVGKPVVVPASVACTAAVLAVGGWLLSRSSADLESSLPVVFTETSAGRHVAADARFLSNPKKLRLLAEAAHAILDRHPLPLPDGMVRADGTPDVSRTAEAEAVVNGINQRMQQTTNVAIESLADAISGPAVAQPALVAAPGNMVPGANVTRVGH